MKKDGASPMIFPWMALDVGKAKTGLAITDTLGLTAQPLALIREKNFSKLIERIEEQAQQLSVKGFIVGLPHNMDGSEGSQAAFSRKVGEALLQRTDLPVAYMDERLTSRAAIQALSHLSTRQMKEKGLVDTTAAMILLQSYLEYSKNQRQAKHNFAQKTWRIPMNKEKNNQEPISLQDNEDNIITLIDEDGQETQFELVMSIEAQDKDYAILAPLEESEEDEAYIFRIEYDGEEEMTLIPIEDDEEYNMVVEVYETLTEDEPEN